MLPALYLFRGSLCMSRRENHWYLVRATLDGVLRGLRPRAKQVALSFVFVGCFMVVYATGALDGVGHHAASPTFVPAFTIVTMACVLAGTFALAKWRNTRARRAYLEALQEPGPEALVDAVSRSMAPAKRFSDFDAMSAQARALAYLFYDRESDATSALAEVDWSSRAPLVQAMGLSAEGLLELLCRRNPTRALELTRRARSLASVNSVLPGAGQTERYYGICVGLCEALSGQASASSIAWLEAGVAGSYPNLKLLGAMGLAAALERAGDNTDRAARLRDSVRQIAPHCRPLRLTAADVAAGPLAAASPDRFSVSGSLVAPEDAKRQQERSAKRKIGMVVAVIIGLWVVLLALQTTLSWVARSAQP